MIPHSDITVDELRGLLESGAVTLAGNRKLKIYGLLTCGSGKRMKKENRVFFADQQEALRAGYRPCGNCMRK
jgi:methylphosphotriester-DNA--protein-cysteine methyltransferase